MSRRRPHGFVDDISEQIPDHGTLTSPFQPSFSYSLAVPQSSTFSYPTTTSHLSYASDEQVLATSATFDGVPSHNPADYSQQYQQQQQQAFCQQPPFFPLYDTQSDTRHQSYYSSPSSRKRQRRDSDMHFPFFSRPAAGHDDQEKPPSSEIADENMNNPSSTMFQQLESICCPWSDYDTPAGKTSAYTAVMASSSLFKVYTSMYENSTVPAYSTPLGSSSHHPISQNQVITSSRPEQSSLFLLSADPHTSQQLHEKFPPLQPVTYLSALPPAGQEPMSYQPFSPQHGNSKSDSNSAFVKSEATEQKPQLADYRTGPSTSLSGAMDYAAAAITDSKASSQHAHDLVRYPAMYQEHASYQPFSVQQESAKPDATPNFMKSEKPEPEYRTVSYRTEPSVPFSVATDYGIAGPKASAYHSHDLVRYPAPQLYPISHDYGPQEAARTEHTGFFQLDSHGNPLDVVMSNQKPQATKRGPFKDPKKRAKTAQVRKIGSCIRCRMQRIRVSITVTPETG